MMVEHMKPVLTNDPRVRTLSKITALKQSITGVNSFVSVFNSRLHEFTSLKLHEAKSFPSLF